MKMRKGILFKISSLLLVLFTLVGAIVNVPMTAKAATTTKVERSYDIAVVYDNSGSMYRDESWCRAKYAMEIFASMLNYNNGDKLSIFPMWEVTTDGSSTTGGSYAPIVIQGKNDIDKISNLYTVNPNNTPFEPALEAHDYLMTSGASEKWLIVLTDGAFNQMTRGIGTNVDLRNELLSLTSNGVNVQYLGFGGASEVAEDTEKRLFTKKSTNDSLMNDLIGICNIIFQRSIMPSKYLNGTNLNVDLSMKNAIVFAQGQNAKINSLKDSSGKDVPKTLDSGQRKYSEIHAYGYPDAPVDKTLAGQVVTFGPVPKGEYTLDCMDVDPSTIQIFYEPDVDIEVSLVNGDGVEVDGSTGEIVAGEYQINAKVVDAVTREDVTNHELMGNDVSLKTYVKTSTDSDYKEYENGTTIDLQPDSETDIYIEGKYLKDYTISSKDSKDLDWMRNIVVVPMTVDFNVKADVLQPDAWYVLKKHDSWEPIRVELTVDGQPLTEEQFTSVGFAVKTKDNIKYRVEQLPDQSAYHVYIAQDENGNFVEPATGWYKMDFEATYVDEYGKETPASDGATFEIQTYSRIWRVLIWIVLLAVLLFLWFIFMKQKVMPKSLVRGPALITTLSSGDLADSFVEVQYRRKARSLSISGPSSLEPAEQCSASFSLRPLDDRFVSPKARRVAVTSLDSVCEEVKLGGTPYYKINEQWVTRNQQRMAEEGKTVPFAEKELSPNPQFELLRSDGNASLRCQVKTIK